MASDPAVVNFSVLSKKLQKIKVNQLLYVLLLVSFFLLGYLFSRVQMYESGYTKSLGTNEQAQAQAAQQGQPIPQAPQGKVDVELGHLPIKGDDDAKVTIVEFSDFECPFCKRFVDSTLSQLEKDYVDTGKVKFYYRHYPLSFHPQAKPLALASECANEQGQFWQYHDKVFSQEIAGATSEDYVTWAGEIGMNTGSFKECFDNKKYEKNVDEDFAAGQKAGVTGTPTFYINGTQLVGAQPIDAFKAAIDKELANN